jgi:hypothetical protein
VAGRRDSHGLSCCGRFFHWADLASRIISDGEGGLLFQFLCPLCNKILRSDDFAFPADFPKR